MKMAFCNKKRLQKKRGMTMVEMIIVIAIIIIILAVVIPPLVIGLNNANEMTGYLG
jgi:prepilin-type N-terminal cleavage/methylation domain-containing protein